MTTAVVEHIPVDTVIFREDLYPRVKRDPALVQLTLGQLCPDVCPPHLTDHPGADIGGGIVYPLGSVSAWFIKKQWEFDANKATTSVYFIRQCGGGPTKIGVATDVEARLSALQTAHAYPLEVVGIWLGATIEDEKRLHAKFSDKRLLGEWFDMTDDEVEVAIHDR